MFFKLFNAATAMAQTATDAAPKGPSLMEILPMPLGLLAIMYFLIIRPQQKKVKEQADLISNLKAGDEVVTNGGIIGKVKSVADAFVTLEVASNTAIKVTKSSISGLAKTILAPAVSTAKEAKT